MLIPDVFARFGLRPAGIIHIGAHMCEERAIYNAAGIDDARILWVEAIPQLVAHCRAQLPPSVRIFQGVIAENSRPVYFQITNNLQSSSFLPLGTHRQHHPDVAEIGGLWLTTTTLPEFLAEVAPQDYTGYMLVMDIQGAEYAALVGAGAALLRRFSAIYLEVNEEEVYEGCGLLADIRGLLEPLGFEMVEKQMTEFRWGDALFVQTKETEMDANIQVAKMRDDARSISA